MDEYEIVTKMIYGFSEDGVNTLIRIYYNLSTHHVTFGRACYQKSGNGNSKTNKKCSQYLGITIAEKVLSKVFVNVKVMRNGNPGFDVICNKGYKVDIKSATKLKNQNAWMFRVNKNQMANYFLCLAFDNRENLNPKHLWLIPGDKINHLTALVISVTTIDKWKGYELTNKLNDVTSCCNIIRGDLHQLH